MPFTESKTRIANLALVQMGAKHTIQSLDEDSEQARVMKLLYDATLDEELTGHNWSFASTRATLERSTEVSAFGETYKEWTYRYTLPSDYLSRALIYNPVMDGTFAIEGKLLLTHEETVYLKYTGRVTTTTKFDPLFVKAFALQLAMKASTRLTGMRERKADLFSEYDLIIQQAMRTNAISRNLPERSGNKPEGHSWVRTGRDV